VKYYYPEIVVPVASGLMYIFFTPEGSEVNELKGYNLEIVNSEPGINIDDVFFIPLEDIDFEYLLKIKKPVIIVAVKGGDSKYVKLVGLIEVDDVLLFELRSAYYAVNLMRSSGQDICSSKQSEDLPESS